MKRVLFLGGAYAQIPILEEAKNRGYYVITCDYLPDNLGHKISDEYHNVSTTDAEGVYALAVELKVDFIVAYASDPAAPVAAYVSERLGLPCNSYQSVKTLGEKDLFRKLLSESGLNTPKTVVFTQNDDAIESLRGLSFPMIIKPTDSSGSKGVSRVDSMGDIQYALEYGLSHSRNKRLIAEEFVDNKKGDVHGDGFVIDGELIFVCLGDHLYNVKTNPLNPSGTIWPSQVTDDYLVKIKSDVATVIRKSGFKQGAINIEARINLKGDHYLMEIGPRSGGHFVPQAINYATGFDMVKATLDVFEGNKVCISPKSVGCVAYYAIHSDVDGTLRSITISDEVKEYIKELHIYIAIDGKVNSFTGANAVVGVAILSFEYHRQREGIMRDISKHIKVRVNESK